MLVKTLKSSFATFCFIFSDLVERDICDYYLLNKKARLSRHLYDLHKLIFYVKINEVLELIPDIQLLRSKIDLCASAKPSINTNKILEIIVESDYYKNDYKNVTSLLIYDDTSYNDCIKTLKEI